MHEGKDGRLLELLRASSNSDDSLSIKALREIIGLSEKINVLLPELIDELEWYKRELKKAWAKYPDLVEDDLETFLNEQDEGE